VFCLTEPTSGVVERILEEAREQGFSYGDVGGTAERQLPSGYTHDRYHLTLGPASRFDAAADGLRHWRAHLGAGVRVEPTDPVATGATYLNIKRVGPMHVLAPVRIVYVVDEPHRFGWAYGTLPGHPEEGEERFVVTRTEEGVTDFDITAFSRPAELLARLLGPVTRVMQKSTTRGYLRGLEQYVFVA